MEELEKKLLKLKAMTLDTTPPVDNLEVPKPPRKSSGASKPIKAPEAGVSASKKDPTKVAEQLKNPDLKNSAMTGIKRGVHKLVKFNAHGQWLLEDLDKVFPVDQDL